MGRLRLLNPERCRSPEDLPAVAGINPGIKPGKDLQDLQNTVDLYNKRVRGKQAQRRRELLARPMRGKIELTGTNRY
jgi:hypothetical protein